MEHKYHLYKAGSKHGMAVIERVLRGAVRDRSPRASRRQVERLVAASPVSIRRISLTCVCQGYGRVLIASGPHAVA